MHRTDFGRVRARFGHRRMHADSALIPIVAGNAAFALNALSFWMRDLNKLRAIAIVSSACFIVYAATAAGTPLWLMIGWSALFAGINLWRLLSERRRKQRQQRSGLVVLPR